MSLRANSRLSSLCQKADYTQPKPYLAPEDIVEDTLQEGVLVKQSKRQNVDPVERMAQYDPLSFNLQNVIAVGAVDKLKPSFISSSNDPSATNVLESLKEPQTNEPETLETNS